MQGEYTQSFSNDEERTQQTLANRERERTNINPAIGQSDRPELAATLFDNYEKQALFIGDLNPNMIKGFWVSDDVINKNKSARFSQFKFYSRSQFIARYVTNEKIQISVSKRNPKAPNGWEYKKEFPDTFIKGQQKLFFPNEEFSWEKLKERMTKNGWEYQSLLDILNNKNGEGKDRYYWVQEYFHPKQEIVIKQLMAQNKVPEK